VEILEKESRKKNILKLLIGENALEIIQPFSNDTKYSNRSSIDDP